MSEVKDPTPEEVLVALYRALNRMKDRMRETGDWPEGEAIRITPRVDLGNLDEVPEERLALYAEVLPELIRRGWARRAGDYDSQGIFSTVDLTQEGQGHAHKLIERSAI